MAKRNRILALLLALLLLAGITACGQVEPRSEQTAAAPLNNQTQAVLLAAVSYADVPDTAWYVEDVAYVTEHGIMDPASDGTFAPEENADRKIIVEGLWRAAGKPLATEAAGFVDASAASVDWAKEQGVVQGYGDGRFGPSDFVTREQCAAMLWRAVGNPESAAIAAFADAADISSYAVTAASWAQENGIINGRPGQVFDAKANITRAEVAAILHRYLTGPGAASVVKDETPVVYFTSNITPEGLVAVYEALGWEPSGKVAVKLSTGEPPASNYLRPELIKDLVHLVDGTIVECNTAYGGSRSSTAMHYQVAEDHGFTAIAPFQILDENGSMSIPVTGGSRLTEDFVGAAFADYDSYLVLSHFKGHQMAGFGGAIKNISIGLGSSEGKAWIHSGGKSKSNPWGGDQTAFTESMAEAGKAVSDYLGNGERIVYVNVMNRISIDCDCNGNPAEPDIHDIGILASTDPVALDQACIDLVWNADGSTSLVNRINNRNGLHTLEHAEEIGLGSRSYTLVDIDARGEEPQGFSIKITVGDRVLTAVLEDNSSTRALVDQMPLTLPMQNLYGREMCYRMGNGALPAEEARDVGYEVGDISYWPPAGSLVILYKQNGEVFEQQPIGHIDDDVSFFDGMGTTDIVFELNEP